MGFPPPVAEKGKHIVPQPRHFHKRECSGNGNAARWISAPSLDFPRESRYAGLCFVGAGVLDGPQGL